MQWTLHKHSKAAAARLSSTSTELLRTPDRSADFWHDYFPGWPRFVHACSGWESRQLKNCTRLQFFTRLACGSLSKKFRIAAPLHVQGSLVLNILYTAERILHLERETAHDRPTNRNFRAVFVMLHCCMVAESESCFSPWTLKSSSKALLYFNRVVKNTRQIHGLLAWFFLRLFNPLLTKQKVSNVL